MDEQDTRRRRFLALLATSMFPRPMIVGPSLGGPVEYVWVVRLRAAASTDLASTLSERVASWIINAREESSEAATTLAPHNRVRITAIDDCRCAVHVLAPDPASDLLNESLAGSAAVLQYLYDECELEDIQGLPVRYWILYLPRTDDGALAPRCPGRDNWRKPRA